MKAGSSHPRGVQQRLAWKEKVKEKQEKKELRKAVMNGSAKAGDRISRPKSLPPTLNDSTFTTYAETELSRKRAPVNASQTLPRQRDRSTEKVNYAYVVT